MLYIEDHKFEAEQNVAEKIGEFIFECDIFEHIVNEVYELAFTGALMAGATVSEANTIAEEVSTEFGG